MWLLNERLRRALLRSADGGHRESADDATGTNPEPASRLVPDA
jgi:hypothetical protein